MFGEKEIVGHTILTISKNRITIPSFTGVEIGEQINPMYDIRKKKLLLMKVSEFEAKLEHFEKTITELRSEGTISYQKLLNYRRYVYGILSFYAEEVDHQRRIHLEPRIIRDLNFGDKVFAVGKGQMLAIYPNQEAYQEDLEYEESKKASTK